MEVRNGATVANRVCWRLLPCDIKRQSALEHLSGRRRPDGVARHPGSGGGAISLAHLRLLPDGKSLPSAGPDARAEPFAVHASSERALCPALQPTAPPMRSSAAGSLSRGNRRCPELSA